MAGILANSTSAQMVSGDTAVSKSVSGYALDEQITLTASPAGTDYVWTLSKPAGSTSRADLNEDDATSALFTPDVEGTYLVTVDVDGTTYNIQIGTVAASVTNQVQVMRLQQLANASVPTPTSGTINLYNSDENNALSQKNDAGTVRKIITEELVRTGSGSPEGAVTASIGTLYLRTDGGASTTLYVKESGASSTGWVAK